MTDGLTRKEGKERRRKGKEMAKRAEGEKRNAAISQLAVQKSVLPEVLAALAEVHHRPAHAAFYIRRRITVEFDFWQFSAVYELYF